jgi:hypothetical protein
LAGTFNGLSALHPLWAIYKRGHLRIQLHSVAETLMNVDKMGVSVCLMKTKGKRVLTSKGCKAKLEFVDLHELTQISLAGTVSPALISLSPLFPAISSVDFKDPELVVLSDQRRRFRILRGYMIAKAMLDYINETVAPCIESLCAEF